MMKWQYKIELIKHLKAAEVKEKLDELGEQRWELVAIYDQWYFFKRPAGFTCEGCCD